MDYAFDINLKNRTILNSFLESFSLEKLNKVPEGFNNNIFWNIVHVVVIQQLLVYNLSGLPMLISDTMAAKYKKGTKTESNVTQDEVNQLKALLFSTVENTKKDYANNLFKNYNAYTTSTNSTMANVDEAIAFNNFHEGIHLGYILALKKLL
jgi:DinB family protein